MAGLEDAKAGNERELNDEYIEELKLKALRKIEANHGRCALTK